MKIKKLILITLAVLLCFSLIACDESVDTPPDDSECTSHIDENNDNKCDTCDTTIQIVADGTVELVKGGSAQFQIVTDAKVSINNYNNIIAILNKINLRLNGKKATAVTEANSTEQTYEILIGSVASRGEEYTFDKHDYGAKGYIIKIVGTKVCVVAGSDEALNDALGELLGEFFGIKNNKVRPIDNLVVTAENNIDKTQQNYSVSELKVDGKRIDDFAITVNSDDVLKTAKIMQNSLYVNTGIWLDIIDESELTDGQSAVRLNLIENGGEGTTDAGFHVYVAEGDLIIDCEFADKIESAINEFLSSAIFNAEKSEIDFTTGTVQTQNVREIYYSDFGARGDGVTDDFAALKSAHEYANKYGHTVHADPNATYYIGNATGGKEIVIQTDTYWHGCKFIFDDSKVAPRSDEYNASIFHIKSEYESITYTDDDIPITSLEAGATNIGWAPGYKAMILVYDKNVYPYIDPYMSAPPSYRLSEMIVVDEEGNISSDTPLYSTYKTVTKMQIYRIDDKPISLVGADGDNQAWIETIFNSALNEYTYYKRNIKVTRSNTTVTGIRHTVTGEIPAYEGGTGAPYDGFLYVDSCNNVNCEALTFHSHEAYASIYNLPYAPMYSYELNVRLCCNITLTNCDQADFNRDVSYGDYQYLFYSTAFYNSKNIIVSGTKLRNLYVSICRNFAIENSEFCNISALGGGDLIIENCKSYFINGPQNRSVINMSPSYGTSWDGNISISGLDIMYHTDIKEKSELCLISVNFSHFYYFYLPHNIDINDVKMIEYGRSDDGEITNLSINELELSLFDSTFTAVENDISNGPSDHKYNDYKYNIPDSITVTNEDPDNPLKIKWPMSVSFKNIKITVDGEEINKQGEHQ